MADDQHLTAPRTPDAPYAYGNGLLQAVGAKPGSHRAGVVPRPGCHLPLSRWPAFAKVLNELGAAAGLDVRCCFSCELRE